eukprot:5413614-Amphidinium_carterae.1
MEYHGTWWTGIEHDDFKTKTYDISQHKFMEDLDFETEVFVDALTKKDLNSPSSTPRRLIPSLP